MTLVFNASPLIILAKAGLLDQILSLTDRVFIPRPVASEITRCNAPSDAASAWLNSLAAQTFIAAPVETSDFVTAWGLGVGESSVISMAETMPGSIAVLDDLAARRCAGALQINVVGTLGLLLMAKNAAIIPSIRGPLDAIISAGLFISRRHVAEILKQAGE